METADTLLETYINNSKISLDFNDLTSIQIGALRSLYNKRIDFDTASDRMHDVIFDLQNMNLVDDTYELTDLGVRAVNLALTLGGSERRKAAARAAFNADIEQLYKECSETEETVDEW